VTLGRGIVGYELDSDIDNGRRPPGLIRLSETLIEHGEVLLDYGSRYSQWIRPARHNMTLYRAASGALVFSTGTIDWGWALDAVHDDPDQIHAPVDSRIQQATVNVFADMGVFASTLAAGLVRSVPSTDTTPPIARIVAPANGELRTIYRELRIEGRVDDIGGVPAGVEVSIDDGITWHPANGVSSWSYSVRPMERGIKTVLARAVDDSGNLQPIASSTTVEVEGLGLRRLAMWTVVTGGTLAVLAGGAWLWFRTRRLKHL
jgi:hypothetical protein